MSLVIKCVAAVYLHLSALAAPNAVTSLARGQGVQPPSLTRALHLFRCGGVEQQHQAALLRVNAHELQQDAVYAQALRDHQQPVAFKQTQKHLGLKLKERRRHVGQSATGTSSLTPAYKS